MISWPYQSGGGFGGSGFGPTERHTQQTEQFTPFSVGFCRGDDGDVESHRCLVTLDGDLGEDGDIGDAQIVVAITVESRGYPPEISDGRKRDRNQAVEKLIHAVAPHGHLGADGHAVGDTGRARQSSR